MKHKKLLPIALVTAIIWFAVEYAWFMVAMQGVVAMNIKAGIPWHNFTAHGYGALVIAALAFGFAFSAMFLTGYQGKGAAEGVRFAILAVLLASVMPILSDASAIDFGRHFVVLSIAGDLIAFLICGVVAGVMAGVSTAAAKA